MLSVTHFFLLSLTQTLNRYKKIKRRRGGGFLRVKSQIVFFIFSHNVNKRENQNRLSRLNGLMSLGELVWFDGISTVVGYLMPNLLYTYILNKYDLVWLGFMVYQPL